MELTGKVAIVTGGAKGMGLGCVHKLAEAGATICIADIDMDEAQKVADSLGENKTKAIAYQVNVADANQIKTMIEQVVDTFGGIDILVNSAGIQRYGTVEETEEDLWDEVMNVNLKSMYLTSKYCIPHMKKRNGGSIVNISSVQAFATQKGVAAYTASKGGINALTRAIAIDYAEDNIRANAVCPASIDTPMLRWAADLFKEDRTVDEIVNQWGKMHPIGRVGRVEEVADYVTYLCSSKAEFITGTCQRIDGGLLAQSPVFLPE